MVALVACFGIDSLFRKVNVAFPASVACLVLLFLALLASESWLGSHRTRKIIAVIDVSVSFVAQDDTDVVLMTLGWLVAPLDGRLLHPFLHPPSSQSAHRRS